MLFSGVCSDSRSDVFHRHPKRQRRTQRMASSAAAICPGAEISSFIDIARPQNDGTTEQRCSSVIFVDREFGGAISIHSRCIQGLYPACSPRESHHLLDGRILDCHLSLVESIAGNASNPDAVFSCQPAISEKVFRLVTGFVIGVPQLHSPLAGQHLCLFESIPGAHVHQGPFFVMGFQDTI